VEEKRGRQIFRGAARAHIAKFRAGELNEWPSLSSAFPAKRFRLFVTNERRPIPRMLSAGRNTETAKEISILYDISDRIQNSSRFSRLLLSTHSQFEVAICFLDTKEGTRKEVQAQAIDIIITEIYVFN